MQGPLTETEIEVAGEILLIPVEGESVVSVGYDINQSSPFAKSELDNAVACSEEGVVFTNSHVSSGVEFCSSLTNDDAAGVDALASKYFDSESLGI